MTFYQRVVTVYFKELKDLLRDRRTLVAMIVVPIVLYPLLMVGSLQAISAQDRKVETLPVIVGGVGPENGPQYRNLAFLDDQYKRIREDRRARAERGEIPDEDVPPAIDLRWQPLESKDVIQQAVRERAVNVGVFFDRAVRDAPGTPNRIETFYDKEELRSASARARLADLIHTVGEEWNHRRRLGLGLGDSYFVPFEMASMDLSSPTSILGQILPLILVLMTITGAIYPAIDVTAGERERGTLETLMVCPVPVLDLIVGKFLVVTTIAIMGAALNLASVCATVYFGGFNRLMSTPQGGLPYTDLLLILVALIPFAVLMSALMLAVCSYARTFKEAQNYITPVILAVLIPGGIAAMPATELKGLMLVIPVGNMVLLARELLIGAHVSAGAVLMVLLSTTLYATAAVALAAKVFGKESVVFADAGGFKTLFDRRLIPPVRRPSATTALMVVALLFPAWFFMQQWIAQSADPAGAGVLYRTAVALPVFFIVLPAAVMIYWKVDLRGGFALHRPRARFMVAALLIGLSSWIVARELAIFQQAVFGTPGILAQNEEALKQTLSGLPVVSLVLLLGVIPGICEECLFRGFMLSGLRGATGKVTAIIVSAVVFGIFHFLLARFPVSFLLGVLLAWICWQSCSIWPAMLVHVMHNPLSALTGLRPELFTWLGLSADASEQSGHLPWPVLLGGGILFVLGGLLMLRAEPARPERTPVDGVAAFDVPAHAGAPD